MFYFITSLLIFIPYTNTDSLVPTVSEYEVSSLSDERNIIAVALDENDGSEINIDRYKSIKNAALYFENLKFTLLDQSTSEYFTKEQEVPIPAIFYISKGEILATYPFPETNSLFLYLCDLILTPSSQVPVISNLSELYKSLNDGPFTILAPPELYDQSLNLQMQLGRELGFIDIKKVTPKILSLLELNETTIAFFRKEDQTIISTSCDFDGIREASLPVYRYLIPQDIMISDKIILSLFCDNLGDEEDTFLYELGEKYADSLIVGYGINIEEYAEKFIEGLAGNSEHQILIFNYPKGFFYNASNFFDIFMNQAFNSNDWFESASKMIDDIFNNVLQPIYLSEEEEEIDNELNKTVFKVVGRNYEEFVLDENHDVIILYKKESCPHCRDFFPIFLSFADECIKHENLYFLKFGFIDIDKNSSPKKFPFMPGVPHVHIFPMKNKSEDKPIRGGRNRESLIRLIKENSKNRIPFDVEPIDKGQLAIEMMQMLMMMDQIPDDEKEGLISDMSKLADSLKELDDNSNDVQSKDSNKIEKNEDDVENNRKFIRNDIL